MTIHYLILYNVGMIARYETEWWYELLTQHISDDYVLIQQFLLVTEKKFLNTLHSFFFILNKQKTQLNELGLNLLGGVLLSQGETPTTIGAEELNFRVRYGNGCDLFAIATKQVESVLSKLDNRCDIIQNVVKSSID